MQAHFIALDNIVVVTANILMSVCMYNTPQPYINKRKVAQPISKDYPWKMSFNREFYNVYDH